MKIGTLLVFGLFVLSSIPSPAKSHEALFASPNFNPAQIDQIDVFVVDPSNDLANNKECIVGAEFGQLNNAGAEVSLAKRGYNKQGRRPKTQFYSTAVPLSEDMLSHPSKDWLQKLADDKYYNRKKEEVLPPGRWIMVITIDDLGARTSPMKGVGRAALSMYLFDRDEAALLWHDQAVEEHMWGGLLGNVMQKGDIKQGTCGDLIPEMVMKLPKK